VPSGARRLAVDRLVPQAGSGDRETRSQRLSHSYFSTWAATHSFYHEATLICVGELVL